MFIELLISKSEALKDEFLFKEAQAYYHQCQFKGMASEAIIFVVTAKYTNASFYIHSIVS